MWKTAAPRSALRAPHISLPPTHIFSIPRTTANVFPYASAELSPSAHNSNS
jgi:hypothetical protein